MDYKEINSNDGKEGSYCLEKHLIEFNSKDGSIITINNKGNALLKMIKTMFHETFHAISGYKTKDCQYRGFRQVYDEDIGVGINEGFTELMAREFILVIIKRMKANIDKSIYERGYNYETTVASIISDMIGKEKMFELYLNGDLKGLIEELKKYSSSENTIKFIDDLDCFTKNRYEKAKEDMSLKVYDIFSYLNKLFYCKVASEMIDYDKVDIIADKLNSINPRKNSAVIR